MITLPKSCWNFQKKVKVVGLILVMSFKFNIKSNHGSVLSGDLAPESFS